LVDANFVLQKAQIHTGMHVADFGCGRTGHLVFPLAKMVGDKGVVYAVDILPDVLESVRRRAMLESFTNIETIWGDISRTDGVIIAKKTVDIVFCVNVFFHLNDYKIVLAEASKLLQDKGKIFIVDWTHHLAGIGPEQSDMIDFEKILAWAKENNFFVQDDFAVGNYHRGLILYRNV